MVKGIPGLDGLYVRGTEYEIGPASDELVLVERIVDRNSIMGDRNVSFPVESGHMFLSRDALVETEDVENRVFAADNPWGSLLLEGRYSRENIEAAFARFERVVQVTVTEFVDGHRKTLFTHYFGETDAWTVDEQFEAVKGVIERCLEGPGDMDDLVFELESLKED
jgi:hypothetical protein